MGNQAIAAKTQAVEVDINELDINIVDPLTKMVVYGYLRRIQSTLNKSRKEHNIVSFIPLEIMQKCLFYYYVAEYFKILGYGIKARCDAIKTYEDARTICLSGTDGLSLTLNPNTSYGNVIIPSQIACVCTWRIKINQTSSMMLVGLTTERDSHREWLSNVDSGSAYYYNPILEEIFKAPLARNQFMHTGGEQYLHSADSQYSKDEVHAVTVRLDLKHKQISFSRNGLKPSRPAFTDIETGIDVSYSLAISLSQNASVTIAGFKKEF